jgi:hypothetical protein
MRSKRQPVEICPERLYDLGALKTKCGLPERVVRDVVRSLTNRRLVVRRECVLYRGCDVIEALTTLATAGEQLNPHWKGIPSDAKEV